MTRLHRRGLATALTALACCSAAVVAGAPSAALAGSGRAVSDRAVSGRAVPGRAVRPRGHLAGPGPEQNWPATLRPGLAPTCWSIPARRPAQPQRGAGTVSRSRAGRYPAACPPWCATEPAISRWPPDSGPPCGAARCSPGGAGGTARLRQVVPLRSPAGASLPGGMRYRFSAWLGGRDRSQAGVTLAFLSAAGRVLARRAIGPAGSASARGGLAFAGGRRHAPAQGQPAPGSRWFWPPR